MCEGPYRWYDSVMAYSVPDLPYDYAALEPHIDEATMRVHHDKHHKTYVDGANTTIEKLAAARSGKAWDTLVGLEQTLAFNLGGHVNHSIFWQNLSPDGGGEPSGALADAINEKFGSFEDFKAAFKEAGIGQFGSGWAWLVADGSGGVDLTSTPNQDNPISSGRTPLLGVDVWEHAYYLKYQNKRPDYIDAWWNTVDWDTVAERFAAARG